MTLPDLIKRLEEAREGSARLDLAIWRCVSGADWRWRDRDLETITWDRYGPGAVANPVVSLDRFTRSLDAALTLVPEGLWAEGTLSRPAYIEVHAPDKYEAMGIGEGATPALALCVAALKAREAQL